MMWLEIDAWMETLRYPTREVVGASLQFRIKINFGGPYGGLLHQTTMNIA